MPATTGGGSLLVAWQLKDKRVLIVGGGDVASGRIESILVTDASITVVSPHVGLHPLAKRLIDSHRERITHHDRLFDGTRDLDGVDMVLTAIDDVEVSREICALCRQLKIPVNVADIPPSCDFYFGSQIRDGPLQIMISTNGQSPKLANLIKRRIEASLPEHAGTAIERVGVLRARLKDVAPGVGGQIGKKRMRWMTDVCTSWEMAELALLGDETVEKMLEVGWKENRVPSAEEMLGKRIQRLPPIPSAVLPCVLGFFAGAAVATVLFVSRRCKVA